MIHRSANKFFVLNVIYIRKSEQKYTNWFRIDQTNEQIKDLFSHLTSLFFPRDNIKPFNLCVKDLLHIYEKYQVRYTIHPSQVCKKSFKSQTPDAA